MSLSINVGAWIAVAWGGSTKQPAGGSFRLALICEPAALAAVQTLAQGQKKLAQILVERYDHRQLTELDLVPEPFLRQVAKEMATDVQALQWRLLAIELQDHDEWKLTYTLPDAPRA